MAYPTALDSFTPKVDTTDDVMALDVNELQTAIENIETELGTDPAGDQTDLKTRLENGMTDSGYILLGDGSTKTISAGVITVTGNFHKVGTEGSAASDDLDTINGYGANQFLHLVSVNDSRDVVIKHGTGNIYCAGGADITLSTSYEMAVLIYDNTNSRWVAATYNSGSLTGGGVVATGGYTLTVPATDTCALLGTANEFTANQTLIDVDVVLSETTGTKIGTATTQKLGFYNATPIVQPTALTTALTQITHTSPGTPDYAIQDMTNSSPYGFVTKDEANTLLSVVLNLQTRVDELETKLQSLGAIA